MQRLDESLRRQLLLHDAAYVGKPFPLKGDIAVAIQANVRHLALLLLNTEIADRASRAAAFCGALIEAVREPHIKEQVACARGCFHCCTTYVSTSLPEVFNLARAVRGKVGTEARIHDAAARARAMPQLQREVTRVICPILEEQACSEYAARPVVCRAVLSTSLESCLRIFQQGGREPFPSPASLGGLRSYVVMILRAALRLAELPHQNFELTHALTIALTVPDSEARWLAGENIFAGVAMDQMELQDSPINKIVEGLAGAVRPTI